MPKAQKTKKRTVIRQKTVRSIWRAPLLIMALLLGITFLVVNEANKEHTTRSRAAATFVNCDVIGSELAFDSEEQAFLTLLNNYRQQNGAAPVTVSQSLNRSAAWLSLDMNMKKYLEHTDSLGRNPQKRTGDCGYTGDGGENIAEVGPTAQEAFNIWKTSTEGHNEEMLNPANKIVGIARSGRYWTLDTGTQDNTDPITPGISPSQSVPSPVCGGSTNSVCPTNAPTVTPPLQNPNPTMANPTLGLEPTSIEPPPTEPVDITEAPSPQPSSGTGQQPGQNPGGNKNIIAFLLQFILLIITFFSSIFK